MGTLGINDGNTITIIGAAPSVADRCAPMTITQLWSDRVRGMSAHRIEVTITCWIILF